MRNRMLSRCVVLALIAGSVPLASAFLNCVLNSLLGSNPSNCQDIKLADSAAPSGVYTIKIEGCADSLTCCVRVYCDMVSLGGGWLEFQRRIDDSVSFDETWAKYRDGIGTPSGNHWLGNAAINKITTAGTTYELLVDLKPFEDNCSYYARYGSFSFDNEASYFTLRLTPKYEGLLSDSLAGHVNQPFTTKDADHDTNGGGNCAHYYTGGGWWFTYCHGSLLNGKVWPGPSSCGTPYASYLIWSGDLGYYRSFQTSFMKIRPANSSLQNPLMGNFCPNKDTTLCALCPEDCGWQCWSAWSLCSGSGSDACTHSRTRILRNSTVNLQGTHCPTGYNIGAIDSGSECKSLLSCDTANRSCASLVLYNYRPPNNCEDIKKANASAVSGVYTVYVPKCNCATTRTCCVQVYCDMESFGGGWLEFQRRVNTFHVSSNSWNTFALGMGSPSSTYWLGNIFLSAITQAASYELLVELTAVETNCSLYARYNNFRIADACDLYRLSVGAKTAGTLGDSLSAHNGKPFSTQDRDDSGFNCSIKNSGAWWYYGNSTCLESNLNSVWNTGLNACVSTSGKHLTWASPRGRWYAYQTSKLKIRPMTSTLNNPALGNYCPNINDVMATTCWSDCQWAAWSAWSTCSVTCENGTQTRNRTLLPAQLGAVDCPAGTPNAQTQTQNCTLPMCPIDCEWDLWGNWSTCSESCGSGSVQRKRSILVQEQYGGSGCNGSATDTDTCDLMDCPSSKVLTVEQIAGRTFQTLGCSWLIGLTSFTFGIFLMLRQFSLERILHMCQEIPLIVAHVIVVVSVNYELTDNTMICKLAAVALHYLFSAHFLFIVLEALQTYTTLTNVISAGGFCNLNIYLLIGWGLPVLLVVPSAGIMHEQYISDTSCWLNMGNNLSLASFVPMTTMAALTFIMVEAAGMGEFKQLPLMPTGKRTTALISRHSLLFIMPLSAASWFLGQYALFTRQVGLYVVVFVLNICLGVAILKFHTLQNEKVRDYLAKLCNCLRTKRKTSQLIKK